MSNATPSASNSPTPPTAEPYVQQTDGSFRAVKLLPRRARDSQHSTLDLERVCWAAPLGECVAPVPEYKHQPPAPVQRGGLKYEWVATMVQPPAPAMPVPVPVYVPRPVVQAAPREEVEDYYSDDDEAHERHPDQQPSSELSSKKEREASPAAAPKLTSAATTAPRRELILDEDYDAVESQDGPMDMDPDFGSAPSASAGNDEDLSPRALRLS